jgi:hypothetical protein
MKQFRFICLAATATTALFFAVNASGSVIASDNFNSYTAGAAVTGGGGSPSGGVGGILEERLRLDSKVQIHFRAVKAIHASPPIPGRVQWLPWKP